MKKDYNVQIIYEFNVKADNIHEARKKANKEHWYGSVGVSYVAKACYANL